MAKRLFDLFFASLGLFVLWPLFLIISVLILIKDGFPIFYRQERVGRFGKPFKIWKFRTMKVQNQGPQLTVAGDKRITPLGQVLRKYKLDELPQLINVLVGEMSFVGPRPEVQKYVDLYNEEQKKILKIRPGLTDLASLKYINENDFLAKSDDPEYFYVNEVMPDKLRLNLKYLEENDLILDTKIIFATLLGKNPT